MMDYFDAYSNGPVWNWFGLSYASYAVFPRVALCSLPLEWQQRFVDLMNEAEELLPDEAKYQDYQVTLRKGGKFCKDPLAEYRHARPFRLRKKA
jgi:hypothetical protein